ncbi:MAG: hypothetical protein PHD01_04490 [Geobacteraceae bacterium]|nr:hypothetical protein [Geobacteraceae bacterium]
MKNKIIHLLRNSPPLKAKTIAKQLGVTKSEINSLLYNLNDLFAVDDDFCWTLVAQDAIQIQLGNSGWVDCTSFEQSLKEVGCLFDNSYQTIEFVIPVNCKILLEAEVRLLALCNQLAQLKKRVKLDFGYYTSTLTYFNRAGFFDHLDKRVSVLPNRPEISTAETYRGNSDALVEFGIISPKNPDENIPTQLKNSFVSYAGENYSTAAFTVISELFGNVRDHSKTMIPGLAALQIYRGKRPHIQTVVSDSGKGIVATLLPAIKKKYPDLCLKYDFDDPLFNVILIKDVFEIGGVSQTGKKDRGLGLKRSQEFAVKYNASISVRQETFEVKLSYFKGELCSFDYTLDMPKIFGTHVCFDFFLDAPA